jgi:hypothetical protein
MFEPVFGDGDGMRAAAPFPDKTGAGFESKAWCGAKPARRPQRMGLTNGEANLPLLRKSRLRQCSMLASAAFDTHAKFLDEGAQELISASGR